MIVDDMYTAKCGNIEVYESDINQLLPTLHKYASECEHITEMGVRGIVSTWAFLAGRPKTLISYDINNPDSQALEYARKAAEEAGVSFTFHQKNVIDVEIEETDMLFIDTLHNYAQMKKELELHGNKARKYLAFHDTFSNKLRGETAGEGQGIWPAIEEFMKDFPEWTITEHLDVNNGLTVLIRNELSA